MLSLSNQPALIREPRIDLQPQLLHLILTTLLYINMQEGTIARLTDKGFGFIKRDGQEKDLFFHSNELVGVSFDELREGDKVTFEIAESPKGPNAVKVSRVS
jgi:CspA family cold shock protein